MVSKLRRFSRVVVPTTLALSLFLGGVGLALAVNLLGAGGQFESFQSYNGQEWRGFPEKVGTGWNVTVVEEDGLHFMDSDTFGRFLAATFGVAYLNYRLEGNFAQGFASRRAFDAVMVRSVPTTPGEDYTLAGKMVTFWKGSGGERNDSKIFKRIGIDPTGDANHTGPNVIWTDWAGADNAWLSPALAVTAPGNTMTLFIQVHNTEPDVGAQYLNTGYLDNFRFELAPVATLNLPSQASPGPVNVTWSVALPDNDYWDLWGYDVQLKDNLTNNWQTIQTHSDGNGSNVSYLLNAQAGRTYWLRVRPWQQRPGGDAATSAMPGVWQEKSLTIGDAVVGRVLNSAGLGLSGVTVSLSGTSTSTQSGANGDYALPTGGAVSVTIQASATGQLTAPPPTTLSIPAGGVARLDLTLRPSGAAQGISNGDFEANLSGWAVSGEAAQSGADRHSGQGSLHLTGETTVGQTNSVSAMDRPLLSFWTKSDAPLTVEFLDEGGVAASRTLPPTGGAWVMVTMDSGLGPGYSGQVGVEFSYSSSSSSAQAGPNIFIDEVSIAAGPTRTYLPLILR